MHFKIISLLAVSLLMSGCFVKKPEIDVAADGSGNTTTQVTSEQVSQPSEPATSVVSQETSPSVVTKESFVSEAGDRVFFGFDRSDLDLDARKTLRLQAAWLNKNQSFTVVVEGHADERGTREYNLALGTRRSAIVKDYLIALGVNENRIRVISYGKERPDVLGSNESAWAANRRVVTEVQSN